MIIAKTIKNAIRNKYAWPGGYPLYLVASDGEALCTGCGKAEFRNIAHSTVKQIGDGWHVHGVEINWEDADLHCAHCGDKIESAYTA